MNVMIRFGKKDGREETTLELKYQIQDLIILRVYELNIVNAETS